MTFELPATEAVTVEFKRDDHRRQSDDELAKAVVCRANGYGCIVCLGVLARLVPHGRLRREGQRRWSRYSAAEEA